METKKNLKKLCSFYVSDVHFGTMILPYISKMLEQGNNVHTIFEKDMHENIEQLISKLNLNKEIKEELFSVEWNKKTEKENIKNCINNINENNEVIIVMGNKKYIDKTNKKIERQLEKKNLEKVTIINCYNVDIFNKNMEKILKTHNNILNTSGERKIEAQF